MSIVSSTFKVDAIAQASGLSWVEEVHTDSIGAVHFFRYLPPIGSNHAALMAVHAEVLAEQFADQEAHEVTNG